MKLRTWHEAMTSGGLDSYANYGGDDWMKDWYMIMGRSRDSDCLEESNFETALAMLDGESDTVQIVRFGHWAVGWIEELMIDPTDTVAVDKAIEIQESLENYPVLDDEDFSNREWELASNYWQSLPLSERVELCSRYGVSIFSARYDHIPTDDDGCLFESLVC